MWGEEKWSTKASKKEEKWSDFMCIKLILGALVSLLGLNQVYGLKNANYAVPGNLKMWILESYHKNIIKLLWSVKMNNFNISWDTRACRSVKTKLKIKTHTENA